MSPTTAIPPSRAGFSLLELVLVMAIVAMVASIATPRYARAQSRYRVDLAARRLADDLAYASTLARVRSVEIRITFEDGDDADKSFYEFEGVDHPDRAGTPYAVSLRDQPYQVVLSSAPGDIKFLPGGMPQDSRTFVIEAGSSQRIVHVDMDTGEVTVQ